MSTINQTVTETLAATGYGSYNQYAAPVVTALVNREQEIVGRLLTFAEQTDLDVDTVRTALGEAGMHMPPQAAQAPQTADGGTAGATGDLAATLGRIEQALSGLTQFARQNGYGG